MEFQMHCLGGKFCFSLHICLCNAMNPSNTTSLYIQNCVSLMIHPSCSMYPSDSINSAVTSIAFQLDMWQ
jgi:hypothetical protein